jgi:hypothetical protein
MLSAETIQHGGSSTDKAPLPDEYWYSEENE